VARDSLGEIDSLLAWRAGGRLLVGRERIALLEAVMEHKSITKAAEITGFSLSHPLICWLSVPANKKI
jgi:molybdate transport system regulatory protein